jgi:hypothetical protein
LFGNQKNVGCFNQYGERKLRYNESYREIKGELGSPFSFKFYSSVTIKS